MLLLDKVEDHNEEKARKLIGKYKKLILDLYDKERYVIHHEMLKSYLKQGVITTEVHKIIIFSEFQWLKKYIDFNIEQRSLAKTTFEKISGSRWTTHFMEKQQKM